MVQGLKHQLAKILTKKFDAWTTIHQYFLPSTFLAIQYAMIVLLYRVYRSTTQLRSQLMH